MTLLEWRDEYSTGIASIDFEHKELISSINGFYEKSTISGVDQSQTLDALGEIHALIESHFALEEAIMRDKSYPDYAPHKEDHDDLLEDIRDIMDDVEEGNQNIGDSLGTRLSEWFANHFATLDKDLHGRLGV